MARPENDIRRARRKACFQYGICRKKTSGSPRVSERYSATRDFIER
jgi:hypothetical protein